MTGPSPTRPSPGSLRSPRLRALLFVALLLAGVCCFSLWGYGWLVVHRYQPEEPGMLSGKTQTQCVGRYLIDTPLELGRFAAQHGTLRYGLAADAPSVQVWVWPRDATPEGFEALLKDNIDWHKEASNAELHIPLFLAQQPWHTPHDRAMLVRHLEVEADSHQRITSDLHLLLGPRYVIVSGTTPAASSPGNPAGPQSYRFSDTGPTEARLRRIAQHLQRYEDASQAPAGFCMDGVVVNDKTMGYVVESGDFPLGSDAPLWRYGAFTLAMQGPLQAPQPSLTGRTAKDSESARWEAVQQGTGLQVVALRRGARSIGPLPGWEFAEGRHLREVTWFSMHWESQGPLAGQSLQRPAIAITMQLGNREAPAAFGAQQALHLWDGMLGSLRLSPANGGPAQ